MVNILFHKAFACELADSLLMQLLVYVFLALYLPFVGAYDLSKLMLLKLAN